MESGNGSGVGAPLTRRSVLAKGVALGGVALAAPALGPRPRVFGVPDAMAGIKSDTESLQAIRLNPSDMSIMPPRFAVAGVAQTPLLLSYQAGFIPDITRVRKVTRDRRGRKVVKVNRRLGAPTFAIRMFSPAGDLFGGWALKTADDPTGHSTNPWCGRMAGPTAAPYTTVQGDPTGLTDDDVTYESRHEGPQPFLYQWSSKFARIRDSDVLDLTFEYFPFALAILPPQLKRDAFGVSPYLINMGMYSGTFMGRPVRYLGSNDRIFGQTAKNLLPTQMFWGTFLEGLTKDGRAEYAVVFGYLDGVTGQQQRIGFYAKQLKAGSRRAEDWDIVLSNKARITVNEWVRRQSDGTAAQHRMQWEFGGKKILIQSRWGGPFDPVCGGSTEEVGEVLNQPAPDRKTQTAGVWRELTGGARSFALQSAWLEASQVDDARVRQIGGTIIP